MIHIGCPHLIFAYFIGGGGGLGGILVSIGDNICVRLDYIN